MCLDEFQIMCLGRLSRLVVESHQDESLIKTYHISRRVSRRVSSAVSRPVVCMRRQEQAWEQRQPRAKVKGSTRQEQGQSCAKWNCGQQQHAHPGTSSAASAWARSSQIASDLQGNLLIDAKSRQSTSKSSAAFRSH